MARVYSKQLWEYSSLTFGSTELGDPPVGTVWVLRHMTMCALSTDHTRIRGFTVALNDGTVLWSFGDRGIVANRDYHWSGRHVVNAGDLLFFNTIDVVNWSSIGSGYELALP